MSNDLISRSEAEKKIRAYADEVGCERGEYELANGILKAACLIGRRENIPAAYDVDKVVEGFEKASVPEDKIMYAALDEFGQFVKLEDAVRIAKSGGVE